MEFEDFIKPLLKWWWLIVVSTLVAAISSYLAIHQQASIYVTDTTLMVGQALENPNPSNNQIVLGQQLSTTYADIGQREPVRQATMQALGLTWLPKYSIRPVINTQLLVISVEDTDPIRAQAVANELANQLIIKSPTNPQENQERIAFINQQLDDLQIKIEETQDGIAEKQEALANMISAIQIADSQAQTDALQTKLNTLQSNYASLLSNTQQGALNTLSVIEPASLPKVPVGPDIPMTILTSSAVGLVLASAAAYLLEYLDKTINDPEEIKKITGLTTLAGIPKIPEKEYPDQLITFIQPRSKISEAYRSFRTNIQFSMIDLPKNAKILITSSNPNEGKSVTAANLGVVLAQAGHKVLILDSDLRRPVQHKIFGLQNMKGLSDVLLGLGDAQIPNEILTLVQWNINKTPIKGLSVLTSGPLPPNPSELLGSNKMKEVIKVLGEYYDYVLLDSPPVLVVTDASILTARTDGTIIVTDSNSTTKKSLSISVQTLRGVSKEANLLGIVINNISPQRGGYYSTNYYGKSYYLDESPKDNNRTSDSDDQQNMDLENLVSKVTRRIQRK
jgi:succinoglycan biosynthesis transport protein ExoP